MEMSAFYGTIQGHRTPATRCGSKASGIRVSAQSWAGSIVVELDGEPSSPEVSIYTAQGSSARGERVLLRAPLARLQCSHTLIDRETDHESAALAACRAVLAWARTPGDHGGNPYCKDFVKLARKALGDE
jgi:hypothetical protein